MKITDVKVHLIRTQRNTTIPSPWILVQVYTDEGLVGLGDGTNWPGGTIIQQVIVELSRLVIGQDPFHIELLFFEEPVPPENIEAMAKVTAALNTPVCTGERRYTRYGFRDLIAAQAVDMIMPDVVRAGGIAETKKIATMAESYYMQVSPHNPNSPVSTLASVHVMANIPNGLLLECVDDEHDVPWRHDLLTDPPQWEEGYLRLPTKPGLGTGLVMSEVEKYRFDE